MLLKKKANIGSARQQFITNWEIVLTEASGRLQEHSERETELTVQRLTADIVNIETSIVERYGPQRAGELKNKVIEVIGEQGWRSGESARLPPMWPGFDSRTRRLMWVEFVVGSCPCSERFFLGYSGFPLSSKTNISKFKFDLDTVEEEPPSGSTANPCLFYLFILFILKIIYNTDGQRN